MNLTDVVLSCRVRLARNVADLPFVSRMSMEQAEAMIRRVNEALNQNGEYRLLRMLDLGDNERMRLVEKHLCSRELAMEAKGALFLDKSETMAIMVNEEDHLRIQCILPGLDLYEADAQSAVVDRTLARALPYAFDAQWGYLSACPTNVGTGMRASAMLHMPALVRSGSAEQVLGAVAKLGLAVRGFYGEGSGAPGHIYQISNSASLGISEDDIVGGLTETIGRLAEQELRYRKAALAHNETALLDAVFRSYGVGRYARSMSFKEFMDHCSNLKLGVSLGLIEGVEQAQIDRMIAKGQSASVCAAGGKLMDESEENIARAAMMRESLQ